MLSKVISPLSRPSPVSLSAESMPEMEDRDELEATESEPAELDGEIQSDKGREPEQEFGEDSQE